MSSSDSSGEVPTEWYEFDHAKLFEVVEGLEKLLEKVLGDAWVVNGLLDVSVVDGAVDFFLVDALSESRLHRLRIDLLRSVPEVAFLEFFFGEEGDGVVVFESVDGADDFLEAVETEWEVHGAGDDGSLVASVLSGSFEEILLDNLD